MTVKDDKHTLTISGVTAKMTGNYKCVATNKHGTAEYSAPVTISDGKTPEPKPEPKKEEKKPEEVKPKEEKPEEPQQEATAEEVVVMETIKLEGEEALPQVTDEKPKEIIEAPVFDEVFPEQTVLEKKTLTLTAKISGKPPPEVVWYRYVCFLLMIFYLLCMTPLSHF